MSVAAADTDALDASAIRALLPAATALRVEVHQQVDSTNAVLLARSDGDSVPLALLAERQTAGRGRRGRDWLAHGRGSLCLSLRWRSERPLQQAAALPVAAGIACAEALRSFHAGVGLKWPNDLVAAGAKLGGILVEARAGADAGSCAVIGVGLNLRLSEPLHAALAAAAQPATDLHALLGAALPARNALAARLLQALLLRLAQLERDGLAALQPAWRALDVLAGRTVRVIDARGERQGIALGLAADGALRVRFAEGEACLHSAEVSVRT